MKAEYPNQLDYSGIDPGSRVAVVAIFYCFDSARIRLQENVVFTSALPRSVHGLCTTNVFHLLGAIPVTSPKQDNEGQDEKRKKAKSRSLDMSEDATWYSGRVANLCRECPD